MLRSIARIAGSVLLGVFVMLPCAASARVDFQRDVRPILADNCFACHGPDEAARLADLRLDTSEGAFAARENGVPVKPRDPDASLLYQRITANDEIRVMPPVHTNKKLDAEQIETLRLWIEQGAPWDDLWSFRPIRRPAEPRVNHEDWVRNPIDRFILARLESEGLSPAPEADRRRLARRVSLDLTGLPPTPELVEEFVNDSSNSAYEALVEKLLASPHWGEHRGRYWLDAARYGDTHGLHVDNYREIWPYRDWVIEAFNRNMPFDQFTIEQIAGDLMPQPTLDQKVATGFHRCAVSTNEAGVVVEEYEAIYAKDRADTTGTVWLGLTVGCATCHDHKFDPILQKDFYALTAFFRNTTQYVMDGNISDSAPFVVVPRPEDRQRWDDLERREALLNSRLERASSEVNKSFDRWLRKGKYRSIVSPLGQGSERLSLNLDEGASVTVEGREAGLDLSHGVKLGEGPEAGRKALQFSDTGWVEIPGIEIDARQPFAMSVWLYMPDEEDRFVVASQINPDDQNRGWDLTISQELARVPGFRFFGDDKDKIEVFNGHMQQFEMGSWNHLAVTYDGSGERAGLELFQNGVHVLTQGSEYFDSIENSVLTGRPMLLGKRIVKPEDEDPQEGYFPGGAIADLRIFNRAISEQEALLISKWSLIERARAKAPSDLTADERDALRLYYLNVEDSRYRKLQRQRLEVALAQREIRRQGATTLVMEERQQGRPEAHILNRGQYDDPGELVAAAAPERLPGMNPSLPPNRLGLAKWLVDDSNPLTARVAVNRFWQQVFGTGIVRTSDDFGAQGEPPSHSELLDWLAIEFRESGWDVKNFFRLLVTSATYRQAAIATPEKIEKDRQNRLLSRGPRFRMDGEMVRDYALAASGLLTPEIGGPSVRPYQPEGVWESVAMIDSNTRFYKPDRGDNLYRRSLYTFWKRAAPPASMDVFNAPTREVCTVRRERTNTPLQALVTLNDPQFIEAARFLGQAALRESGEDLDGQIDYLALRLLSRLLDAKERHAAKRTYQDLLAHYQADVELGRDLLDVGDSKPDEALPVPESAALTMLASQIMNLDGVLNK